jgi:hypothetical protein
MAAAKEKTCLIITRAVALLFLLAATAASAHASSATENRASKKSALPTESIHSQPLQLLELHQVKAPVRWYDASGYTFAAEDSGRFSGRYDDGQKAYRTNVPRDANNNPIPDPEATGAHSRLQPDARDPSRTYSATEFDENGQAVKRVDFAGRKGDTLPHQHPYDPKTKGFGSKEPLDNGG